MTTKRIIITLIAAVGLVLFVLGRFSNLLVDWLWFGELGYRTVFVRLLSLKLGLGILAGAILLAYFGGNLHFAVKHGLTKAAKDQERFIADVTGAHYKIRPSLLILTAWLFTLLLVVPFSLYFSGQWDTVLRFFWGETFGQVDPVFGRDLSFYVFRLPFWQTLQGSLTFLAAITFIATLASSLSAGYIRRQGDGLEWPRRAALRQLGFLLLLFLFSYSWGWYLDRYELLFSSGGLVYGAGFTDLHVVRISLWLLCGASILLGVAVWLLALRKKSRWLLGLCGGYFLLLALALVIVPQAVQTFYVNPNELELEAPYLENEINATRNAYAIDRLQERSYGALTDLTRKDLEKNRQTLNNIRLWDWRPLLQTYRQLQEIRLYYQFYEVDVDRYYLDGDYRQVMLSARELSQELPQRADTWVNRTLQFTHGYGLVMSLASLEGEEGTPTFLVQDLPPKTTRGLTVDNAAIFYGERMTGYRIVNTATRELDYPKGDKNVYTSYAGDGGMLIDNWWKKLLFAWDLGDINILLSEYLTGESRLQLRRRVRERINTIAPFLRLDADPYLVVAKTGKLFWVQDAYTTTDRYPYAEPYNRQFNYIRNSVKVVIDAFNGTVRFYTVEENEPVLQAYRSAFPDVFRPLNELPADLRQHLRYPEDLFRVQVDKFSRYHMTIPQVFYNNEDLWTLPEEKYAGDQITMEPYYILMRLPEEERLEFLLMQPLTPSNRDNMIAWLAARCDAPNYGSLLVYKLPKEKLIFGPLQVEAMIDQDPVISQQLSLWDQRGSRVIRGNLLVIPMNHSFIYVEPVYLIAEGNNIPQLRRVIVAYNDRVVMEPTLKKAVSSIFQPEAGTTGKETGLLPQNAGTTTMKMKQIRGVFERAQQALKDGDWENFGRAMGELQNAVEQ